MSSSPAPATLAGADAASAGVPGPWLPMPVQTALWILMPLPFMRWCRRRHGEIFRVKLPLSNGGIINVCDPAAVKTVFTGNPDRLRAGEANVILEPLLGTRSVLLLDGPEHIRQRKLMLPSFHGERMQRYGAVMTAITEREIATWRAGETMQLEPRMQRITLEVILRTVFGLDDGERLVELRDKLRRLLDAGSSPLTLIPSMRRSDRAGRPVGTFARLMALKAQVDSVLYDEIARRRARTDLAERDDILSLLLQARDEQGQPMTDQELRDELMTLLAAGHETTATSLAWFFELMLRHPAAMRRLEDELAHDRTEYLDAAIKETMRLRPVVPVVVRHLLDPLEVAGHRLPAGTIVGCNIVLTHRHQPTYDDPESFRPERFVDKATETYSWIPFGGGIRRCLGASFAHYEMRTVIPTILARTRLRTGSPRGERVKRRAVTLVPSRRARVIVDEVRAAA
jgi:cytochrome P450